MQSTICEQTPAHNNLHNQQCKHMMKPRTTDGTPAYRVHLRLGIAKSSVTQHSDPTRQEKPQETLPLWSECCQPPQYSSILPTRSFPSPLSLSHTNTQEHKVDAWNAHSTATNANRTLMACSVCEACIHYVSAHPPTGHHTISIQQLATLSAHPLPLPLLRPCYQDAGTKATLPQSR